MTLSKSVYTVGLVLFLFTTSCKKDNIGNDCSNRTAFVKDVKNSEGRIYFDAIQNKYMLLVVNSMDSYDVGYICRLSTKFQKEGLVVKFSGRYFEYDKPAQGVAGDKFYYLSVDEITAK